MPLPLAEFMNRIGRLSLAAGQGGCPLLTAPREMRPRGRRPPRLRPGRRLSPHRLGVVRTAR